jgi:choline dehydrogenase
MIAFPSIYLVIVTIALYGCLCNARLTKRLKQPTELTEDVQSLRSQIFDFIIVGGGTAGLVVANRLSELKDVRVLVIEAGQDTREDINVKRANETYGFNQESPVHSHKYITTPQIGGGNKLEWFGRGLGGSSTVNGQVWNGPSKEQLDSIGHLGNDGWSFRDLLPYYIKAQNYNPPSEEVARLGVTFNPHVHRQGGPVSLSHPPVTFSGPPQIAFVKGLKSALKVNAAEDLQSGDNDGVAFVAQTIYPDSDLQRVSSATSYYSPIEGKRPNLTILLNHRAIKIQLDDQKDENGNLKATGVVVQSAADSEEITLSTKGEVILSAGSIRSPFLLEHSGVGDKAILDKIEVKQMIDLPGVGKNLAEQCQVGVNAKNKNPAWKGDGASSSIAQPTAKHIFANVSQVAKYVDENIGQWAKEQVDAGAAVNVDAVIKQYKMIAHSIFKGKTPTTEFFFGNGFWGGQGADFSISTYTLTVFSRGYTHAISKNPWEAPEVNPRFWTVPIDMDLEVASLIAAKKVFASSEMLAVMNGTLSTPNCSQAEKGSTEEYSCFRDHVIKTYGVLDHAVGTCAMLPLNDGGVVDAEFKVYGTSNVRTVDASVLPFQISAHTQATVYASAEKASDVIKATSSTLKKTILGPVTLDVDVHL